MTYAENFAVLSSYLIDNFHKTISDPLDCVVTRIDRLRRTTITQGVRRNNTIAFVGKVVDLMAPVVGRRGEAVNEQNVRVVLDFRMLVVCCVVEARKGHESEDRVWQQFRGHGGRGSIARVV